MEHGLTVLHGLLLVLLALLGSHRRDGSRRRIVDFDGQQFHAHGGVDGNSLGNEAGRLAGEMDGDFDLAVGASFEVPRLLWQLRDGATATGLATFDDDFVGPDVGEVKDKRRFSFADFGVVSLGFGIEDQGRFLRDIGHRNGNRRDRACGVNQGRAAGTKRTVRAGDNARWTHIGSRRSRRSWRLRQYSRRRAKRCQNQNPSKFVHKEREFTQTFL